MCLYGSSMTTMMEGLLSRSSVYAKEPLILILRKAKPSSSIRWRLSGSLEMVLAPPPSTLVASFLLTFRILWMEEDKNCGLLLEFVASRRRMMMRRTDSFMIGWWRCIATLSINEFGFWIACCWQGIFIFCHTNGMIRVNKLKTARIELLQFESIGIEDTIN